MTSERELIRRAKAGDAQAFEALVNLHLPYVFNLALRTLNNHAEAEDMAQETFVRVWRNLASFRGDAQFRTWLYRIVTNLCYNRLPRLKRDLQSLDPDDELTLVDDSQSVEATIQDAELTLLLQDTIQTLPESYRLLITLRHLQGMSYADIADVVELPLGTVKTGIFRARRDLRAQLLMKMSDQDSL